MNGIMLKRPIWSLMKAQSFRSYTPPQQLKAYIYGQWINAVRGKQLQVYNPYTDECIAEVPDCDVPDMQQAILGAREAFPSWANDYTAKERGEMLRLWHDTYKHNEKMSAEILMKEQGKPLAEALTEVRYAASYIDWYAGEARRIYGQVVQPPVLNRTHLHVREPIGVVVAFTPWNFPAAMIARKAAAAIAAGCTFVVKPSHETPLSAIILAQCAEHLPKGVFNVVPSSHENTLEISKYACKSDLVDCISFTGSTEVGKLLLAQSANTVKRLCLELGGNAPFIVFESADLDKAVQGALASKTRASGQTCVSSNRYFVHEKVHDAFVKKLVEAFKKLKCGNGDRDVVTQGPLINENAFQKVNALVEDALEQGAKAVLTDVHCPETNIFKPTILTEVTEKMKVAQTEIFGPVVAIQKFKEEADVIARANSTRFGLASYFFSQDYKQIHRVSKALQSGMVGVNEGAISCAEAAFGGVKESGMGREGGPQGIDEFTQWKYICIGH